MLSAIVAMDRNRVIGFQNQMPWHLPADLKHFKNITMGHPIIMGRNTYDSLGKPLPGRNNIVITRRPLVAPAEILQVANVTDALKAAEQTDEIFIIGGQQIFEQTLEQVQRIYLTRIEHEFSGDRYFPELNEQTWKVISSENHAPDERNVYPYTFLIMERI
jgi:dihydrofolate reductase